MPSSSSYHDAPRDKTIVPDLDLRTMMLTPAMEFFGHTSPPMDASWRHSSESERTSIVDYGEEIIAEANGDYKLEREKMRLFLSARAVVDST